jgi:SAM-dependent methyltransferase
MIKRLLRHGLDEMGLVARAYDFRARAEHALDRETKQKNSLFRAAGAPDGLPLPPASLVYLVAGHFNVEWYYKSGVSHAALLREVLAANGFDVREFDSLLDFGCGCGRVIRHWHDHSAPQLHGTDYNPRLIAWCRRYLPFADFETNHPAPPLGYGDDTFDFIYAISVFTHLTERLQHAWMRELERVLAPGGVLAITTKGRSRLEPLGDEERRRFERGELVVQDARYEGRNLCAAYHPERYVREELAGALEVLDFVPAVAGGVQTQDVFLLRRPG